MEYKITFTERFQKSFKKLDINEKKILKNNPMHPSLRTKRIQGIEGLFECSVNMDIRIIWYYEKDRIIVLLDVGHHDILNKI